MFLIVQLVVVFKIQSHPDWLDNTATAYRKEFVDAVAAGTAFNVSLISQCEHYRWDWLDFVDGLLFTSTENAFFALLGFSGLFQLGVFLPTLAVTARRLHDTDKSGWWMLLYLTIIGGIVVFIFTLLRGNEGSNKYGEDPYAVANK